MAAVRRRRNIFENKKYVEEYPAEDVASELGLDRGKLIRLAQLLGSDYTPGVGGIGAQLCPSHKLSNPTEKSCRHPLLSLDTGSVKQRSRRVVLRSFQ